MPALEAAGRRETESSEVLADAQTRLEQAEEAAQGVGERFGVLEEGVRDTQGRLEQSEHGLDHLRTALEERLEDLDRRVAELGPIPAAAPREPTRAALGLADRRETGTRPGREGGAEDPASEPAGADVAADRQEDMGTGMRGVLLVVIGLAALTMLLRWMGVGR